MPERKTAVILSVDDDVLKWFEEQGADFQQRGIANLPRSASGIARNAIEQIVPGEPRLRALHQAFILSGCRDSRGHLNRYADCLGLMRNLQENEQLLTGLAFENLIKGILIQRDTTLVTWEKIESGILPRGGHGISSRAKKILNLAPREFNLLQRIEEYLFWAGRYPLPLKSGI